MNHTTASCGCSVIAVGAPGSLARRVQELRSCEKPRCRSGLPDKFTDEECEAWCWLKDNGITGWSVCVITKLCWEYPEPDYSRRYPGLVEFALAKGMT